MIGLAWNGFLTVAMTLTGAPRGEGEGWLTRIGTVDELTRFSKPSLLPIVARQTKFTVPVPDGGADLLPTLFQNVNHYPLHADFFRSEFPDQFSGLSDAEYLALVERREGRQYFAGRLFVFEGDPVTYGFEIFTVPEEPPTLEEARWVHDQLREVFALGPVAYSPKERPAIREAESWEDPGFEVNFAFGSNTFTYVPYTRAENFGRVKVLTLRDFDRLNERGAFSFQDILVIEEAPRDIEGVVAGVITGTIQTELDHLAVRTARRGTPNAYVKDALDAFAPFDGKLVRLTVGTTGYEVDDQVTLADAEAWWESHRPNLGAPPAVDADYRRLDAMEDIPVDGSIDLVTRYGGKGGNFAVLFHLLPEEHRVPGFVVPFSYYLQFIDENRVPSRSDPARSVSIREYVAELLEEPEFKGDSTYRFVELARLREIIEDGAVDPGVVRAIALKVVRVFGTAKRKVRFRSSSNAEDQLEFNGAGLYRSVSGCAADDLDSGDNGPSQCDPTDPREDGIARSLKAVWASLWNYRAFEEREFFRIPHADVHMAVLVSEAFPDELANGVAFTGNPDVVGDRNFLINVQLGDTPVVFTDPGVIAEKDILVFEDGVITNILRVRRSSLVPPDTYILSDEQLLLMGEVMASVEARYPFELGEHRRDEVLLDFEFKIDRDGRLRFKQVRPFLISTTDEPPPEFRVTVPEGLTACGGFAENKDPRAILEQKIIVGFRPGVHVLETSGTTPANILEWAQFELDGPRVPPVGPGTWTAIFQDRGFGQGEGYAFLTTQEFEAAPGEIVEVSIHNLFIPLAAPQVELDPLAITPAINPYLFYSEALFCDFPLNCHAPFNPCDMSHLPSYTVDVEFEDGSTAHFEERFQILEEGTGPAELMSARVTLGDETRVIDDYFHLAYTAGHHNDQPPPEHWAVFDPPIDYDGVLVGALVVVQGWEEDGPSARLLDENLEEIEPLEVVSFVRLREGIDPSIFRRGDVDFSGSVNIADAVKILHSLFLSGTPLLCPDAADVDDHGTIDISDATIILAYLFLRDEPPAAPGPANCGRDVEPDTLAICNGSGCE